MSFVGYCNNDNHNFIVCMRKENIANKLMLEIFLSKKKNLSKYHLFLREYPHYEHI